MLDFLSQIARPLSSPKKSVTHPALEWQRPESESTRLEPHYSDDKAVAIEPSLPHSCSGGERPFYFCIQMCYTNYLRLAVRQDC